MEMDIDEIFQPLECYKIPIETYKPLNMIISFDDGVETVILWNEFSILLYDADRLTESPIVYFHDCAIENVQNKRNILLLHDCKNILHFTILRKEGDKNRTLMKNIKFKQIFHNIIKMLIDDGIYTLQHTENELYINTFNILGSSKFKSYKKFKLDKSSLTDIVKIQMYIKDLDYFSADFVKYVLNVDQNEIDMKVLFVVSGDSVYTSVLKNDINRLSLLYSCPSVIKCIRFDVTESSMMFLFLNTGSAILLSPRVEQKCIHVDTIHLNCSIERVTLKNKCIFYADIFKFWQCTLLYEKDELITKQRCMKVKNVFDFTLNNEKNKIFCVTVYNLLYIINLDSDEWSSSNDVKNEYIPVTKSLKETKKVFDNILNEMKENDRVIKMIEEENNLITTISLSRKPELSLCHLKAKIFIYDDMKDFDYTAENVRLVTELQQYYKSNIQIYSVEFYMTEEFQSKFKEFQQCKQRWYLSVQFKDFDECFAITVDLRDGNNLKIAVPLNCNLNIPTDLEIKLVSLIRDAINEKVYTWCLFPSRTVRVDVKYHMKTNNENKHCERKFLRRINQNVNDKVLEIAHRNTNLICSIVKLNDSGKPMHNFTYYVRIPEPHEDYGEKFIKRLVEFLNPKNARSIGETIDLRSAKELKIEIKKKIINICIILDNNIKKFKITSDDYKLSWNLYKFIFSLLLNYAKVDKKRSIPHFDFMKLKRLKETVNKIMTSDSYPDMITLMRLSEEFSCNIIGILPL